MTAQLTIERARAEDADDVFRLLETESPSGGFSHELIAAAIRLAS
jgi:hypothetical protein